jgi:hypothetical protein
MTKSLVFRIRREYFDAIVRGDKQIEWRKDSEFWRTRMKEYVGKKKPDAIAVFICGKMLHRREIIIIHKLPTPFGFSEQGKKDVPTSHAFAIHLGKETELGDFLKFPIHGRGYRRPLEYIEDIEEWRKDTIKKLEQAQRDLKLILGSELMKQAERFVPRVRERWEGQLSVVKELIGALKP